MIVWNPWHGCHKISPGCANCYVYRRDESIGKDASLVVKTQDFNLPIKLTRQKEYRLKPDDGTVYTCMTSDFFLEEADSWRQDCWDIIRKRQDLKFTIITKRIDRFTVGLPLDWGDGWDNVTICSTAENQNRADFRIPYLLSLPIKHREIICEPLLQEITLDKYLKTGKIERVICGGESGSHTRPCDFRWIQTIRLECIRNSVPFTFKQTGSLFIKDSRTYHIERKFQESQAQKSHYSYIPNANSGAGIRYTLPNFQRLFEGLSRSNFRSRFHLKEKDLAYISEKGLPTIQKHAEDFILKRLSPENPEHDGSQTPMQGHPVFIAQHACACCCRGCLEKWHHIPSGKVLTSEEQKYIVNVLMYWIQKESHIRN